MSEYIELSGPWMRQTPHFLRQRLLKPKAQSVKPKALSTGPKAFYNNRDLMDAKLFISISILLKLSFRLCALGFPLYAYYSALKLTTGFPKAAFTAWKLTVKKVMMIIEIPAIMKIPAPIDILYAKPFNH